MTQPPFETHLATYLNNVSSNEKAIREQAEAGIQQLEEANWPVFVQGLAQELGNEKSSEPTRQMAGVLLKNALDAKDARLQAAKSEKWKALDATMKGSIRSLLTSTLTSKVPGAAHGASMVIAKVAKIELLSNEWPDLLEGLHQLVEPTQQDLTRVYALECLGYICEEHAEVAQNFPQQETNRILTSIVKGMAGTQPIEVRLHATRALCDALEFAALNFEKREERDYLMQMICEATISPDGRTRVAAYSCLVKVADMHYEYLDAYIQTIYTLTLQGFVDQEEDVAMTAIEFWTSLAEIEEEYLHQEDLDVVDSNVEDSEYKRFVERCASDLVPKLLDLLREQSDVEDDFTYTKADAAGTCLVHVMGVVKDNVLEIVTNFIKENVAKRSTEEDWRSRDAAMLAFGCMLEGPSRARLLQFVGEAFGWLIQHGLQDPNNIVRLTTVWTLGRIFRFLHGPNLQPPLVTQENVTPIVNALLTAMQGGVSMATRSAEAISYLAEGFPETAEQHELTPFFQPIVESLLAVIYAPLPHDQMAVNLHISAFEALNSMIQYSAFGSMEMVAQMVPHLLTRISETFSNDANSDPNFASRRSSLQLHLCSTLQVTIERVRNHDQARQALLAHYADLIMEALVKIQSSRSSISEDVIMTMNALCLTAGQGFTRYLQHVMQYILAGLSKHEETGVCRCCINFVGDIARECTTGFVQFADSIMEMLLSNLQSESLNREVKPDILSVFGDMAQGLDKHFDKWVAKVVETLQAAMNIAYSNWMTYKDEEEASFPVINYNNELRSGIITACAGIVSIVPSDPTQTPPHTSQIVLPFGVNVLKFLHLVHQDHECTDAALRKQALGLLGDLCRVPGLAPTIASPENRSWIPDFMRTNRTIATPEPYNWTERNLHQISAL